MLLRYQTNEGCPIRRAGQQVVHDEQEDGVAQDEGHLEGGAVDAMRRQVEGQDVDDHEEGAGDEQVHHIEHWLPLDHDLGNGSRLAFALASERTKGGGTAGANKIYCPNAVSGSALLPKD